MRSDILRERCVSCYTFLATLLYERFNALASLRVALDAQCFPMSIYALFKNECVPRCRATRFVFKVRSPAPAIRAALYPNNNAFSTYFEATKSFVLLLAC